MRKTFKTIFFKPQPSHKQKQNNLFCKVFSPPISELQTFNCTRSISKFKKFKSIQSLKDRSIQSLLRQIRSNSEQSSSLFEDSKFVRKNPKELKAVFVNIQRVIVCKDTFNVVKAVFVDIQRYQGSQKVFKAKTS